MRCRLCLILTAPITHPGVSCQREAVVTTNTARHDVQGYHANKKLLPLGPYSGTVPRALGWSWGGGAVSYERGTPVASDIAWGLVWEKLLHYILLAGVVQGYLARCGTSLKGVVQGYFAHMEEHPLGAYSRSHLGPCGGSRGGGSS